jgi:hypothetical protein
MSIYSFDITTKDGNRILPANHPESRYKNHKPYRAGDWGDIFELDVMVEEQSVDFLTETHHNGDICKLKIFKVVDYVDIDKQRKIHTHYDHFDKVENTVYELLSKELNSEQIDNIKLQKNEYPKLVFFSIHDKRTKYTGSLITNDRRGYPNEYDNVFINISLDDLASKMYDDTNTNFRKFYIITYYDYHIPLEKLFLKNFIEPKQTMEDENQTVKIYYFEI